MSDLISRQAAIDAHCKLCGNRGKCNCDICSDVEAFRLIPARPEIMMSDLISRYEQGRIQGHVEMRTALLKELKEVVGGEVWENI